MDRFEGFHGEEEGEGGEGDRKEAGVGFQPGHEGQFTGFARGQSPEVAVPLQAEPSLWLLAC